MQDFQSDGVVYLELRTTPRNLSEHLASKDQYVDALLGVIKTHNDDPSNAMQAFLILSVDRRNTVAEAEEVVDLAIKYQQNGVVGVDLCGNPAVGDVRIFTQTFARAKAAGLKLTIHFAEIEASASDVELQTILSWKPDRLGHVIHVNDQFRKHIESENIAVELCLSCNVHAKMITGTYPDHHFGIWRHSSVPVVLCVSGDEPATFPMLRRCRLMMWECSAVLSHRNTTWQPSTSISTVLNFRRYVSVQSTPSLLVPNNGCGCVRYILTGRVSLYLGT